jgi:hypothetical protein
MEKRNEKIDIDFGLHVTFDEKQYRLAMENCTERYPVGGLVSEYFRLDPKDIKELILSCDGLNEKSTAQQAADTLYNFHQNLCSKFPPVTGNMIALEFYNAEGDLYTALRENRTKELLDVLDDESYTSIREYILEDTGYSAIGCETVLQLLLTSYLQFSIVYCYAKSIFIKLMEVDEIHDEEHEINFDFFASMYGDYMDMQHIDYRIVMLDERFQNLYTIKSSISLLLFEMAHCINLDIKFVKCKNCGNYFVPEGRSDTIYCSYPLQDNKEKTCKDVGAQITRANKEKNDECTREYRKLYMRYKMKANRHPGNIQLSKKLGELTNTAKSWRKKLANGSASTEEFIKWLERFQNECNT